MKNKVPPRVLEDAGTFVEDWQSHREHVKKHPLPYIKALTAELVKSTPRTAQQIADILHEMVPGWSCGRLKAIVDREFPEHDGMYILQIARRNVSAS